MNAVTMKDIARVLANIEKTRTTLGIDPEIVTYHVNEGSKRNGIAFRIYGHRAGETGHSHVSVAADGMGFIGWTKSEAYETLRNINAALAAVADARA